MDITDAALDARLTRADRGRGLSPDGATLTALAAATRAEARRRSLRGRLLAGAGALALAIALGVALPANAAAIRHFLANTVTAALDMDRWIHGDGGTEIVRDSEFVDTSQSDLRDYVEQDFEAWLPLAPGQTREAVVDAVTASHAANPGLTQEVGLRRSMERVVYIGWLDEWLDARAAGDAERQATAVAVLRSAADWPAFVATDGGGLSGIKRVMAERIAAGDADAAEFMLQMEAAPSWDGVDRPQFAPVIREQVRLDCQARPELGCSGARP